MLCAISGEAPQVPVASKKSGTIFEKRLIEAYIVENGKDPITNEELALEDLVELKTDRTVKPRAPQLTSVPSLLAAFQNEWDAVALERFSIQQQLEQTRRELSRALYENECAHRIIPKLQRERDEARDTLSKLSLNSNAGADDLGMQTENHGLPLELTGAVSETQATLSKTRRKRPIPDEWVKAEDLGNFKARKLDQVGKPESRFLAQHQKGDQLLHTGGQQPGSIALFDVQTAQTKSLETAQDGVLTDAVWMPDGTILAGSATGNICLRGAGETPAFVLQSHRAGITSVSVHASGRIFASTSTDRTFILYDTTSKTPVTQIRTEAPLLTGRFHPDGHLFAVGDANGQIKLYETASGTLAATFTMSGPVQTLSFSENGTWLAASVKDDSTVQIWDLKKTAVLHSLSAPGPVIGTAWDYTGQFLAVATNSGIVVHSYHKTSKQWAEAFQTTVAANALAWGPSGRSLNCIDSEGVIFALA